MTIKPFSFGNTHQAYEVGGIGAQVRTWAALNTGDQSIHTSLELKISRSSADAYSDIRLTAGELRTLAVHCQNTAFHIEKLIELSCINYAVENPTLELVDIFKRMNVMRTNQGLQTLSGLPSTLLQALAEHAEPA